MDTGDRRLATGMVVGHRTASQKVIEGEGHWGRWGHGVGAGREAL